MRIIKLLAYICFLAVLIAGCGNSVTNSVEMSASETKDMYNEFELEFTKQLRIDSNDYHIVNLNEFSDVAKQLFGDEEFNVLNPVFIEAFYIEDYERTSPSIIYISNGLEEIIISFLSSNNVQVNTYLVHDEEWKVTIEEIKTK